MRKKSSHLALPIVASALLALHANSTWSAPSPANTSAPTATITAAPSAATDPAASPAAPTITATTPALPEDPQLDCRDIPPQLPHVVLVAKTKDGDKYGEVPFGCVQFHDAEKLTPPQFTALDAAAAYLLQVKNVVRVYLDLSIPAYAARNAQKHYREQAFAVKNYLTEKGVFTHLQDVRKAHYPVPQQQAAANTPLAPKNKAAIAAKPAAAPKRKNPSAEYTYHFNKPDLTLPNDDPSLYQTAVPGPFQFIPLENIYFIHGKDNLTERAQAVLDAIAQHVLRAGGDARVLVRGHADETGSAGYNYRLTDRRAVAVRDYLADRGVPVAQIEVFSRGEVSPVDENWVREGRARNRRVELYLVQRDKIPLLNSVTPGP